MLISKNWLQDFVEIPKNLKPRELMEKMTLASVEVEGIRDLTIELDKVIVAEILEVKKHPNADKLQIAIVNDGDKKLSVVCGAPNIAVGQKVPLAQVGAFLPAVGLKIEARKVRGQLSEGMLCAADELGLGHDHEGILVLDDNLKIGQPLVKALGLDDWILEIDNKSMTHRPDMWGHYGVARDVSAFLKTKFKEIKFKDIKVEGREKLEVKVKDFKACPRYMALVIDGLKVGPSPDWLQKRLIAIGQKPINNIVDITNYVMFELGQPLHAFDYQQVAGAQIVVRKAEKYEKVTTLDKQELELTTQDLVIADQDKILAVAGIKGALNSGVNPQTTKIILESANFDHIGIRRSSSRLALRTEASSRYEKSLDPNLSPMSLARAVDLIQEIIPGAKVVSEIVDQSNFKLDQGPIKTSVTYIQEKIGQKISQKEIIDILTRLGFEVKVSGDNLLVTVPTWRATKDISIEQDLVEEVARIYGYNNIEAHLPKSQIVRPEFDPLHELIFKIRDILAYGFDSSEVYNYSFISEKEVKVLEEDVDKFIKVTNPQATGLELLRRNIAPGLIKNVVVNQHNFDQFNLFEIGQVYILEEKGLPVDGQGKSFLPKQDVVLAGLIYDSGNQEPYYVAKNITDVLLHRLHFVADFVIQDSLKPWLNSLRSVAIKIKNQEVGFVGELDLKIAKKLKIKERVALYEINLSKLAQEYSDNQQYQAIPKFPSIELDISIIVPQKVLWQQIKDLVLTVDKDIIRQVELFDIYQGDKISSGKKSVAFRVTYRSDDKTLELKEAEKINNQIKELLKKKLGAEVREG